MLSVLLTRVRVHVQFLYFMSSFFGQFGPNATTWMLPGEIFPTDVRATCHGLSAAIGKAGALLAGIFFHYMTTECALHTALFPHSPAGHGFDPAAQTSGRTALSFEHPSWLKWEAPLTLPEHSFQLIYRIHVSPIQRSSLPFCQP